MKDNRQAGAMNLLAVPLILVTLLLFGIAALAYMYYGQAMDYKNNVDQKVGAAVSKAEQAVSDQKDKDFAEKEKSPYTRYDGPGSFGAIRILYPKTWSAYVSEPRGSSSRPVDGYFYPHVVPSISEPTNSFALRVTVEQQPYDSVLREYQGRVKEGKMTGHPYQSPNVANVVGTRLDGAITDSKQGSMIIMPLRDKTLKLWTESKDYQADFDNIILPGFSFTP